jgi:hypothetical protein
MRIKNVVASALIVIAAGAGGVSAEPKGTRTSIAGEVVDLWCYVEGGDRGPAKKDCAVACAKAGNPIGLVDAKGNVYVAAGLNDHQPANSLLLQKMSSRVTVTGTLVKAAGLQMIYIESVK